jgi:hypothetical protein
MAYGTVSAGWSIDRYFGFCSHFQADTIIFSAASFAVHRKSRFTLDASACKTGSIATHASVRAIPHRLMRIFNKQISCTIRIHKVLREFWLIGKCLGMPQTAHVEEEQCWPVPLAYTIA